MSAIAPILEELPAKVRERLAELREGLDGDMPAKNLDRNLLVGTWNIRAFEDLTEKWEAGPGDSPKRDLAAIGRVEPGVMASNLDFNSLSPG